MHVIHQPISVRQVRLIAMFRGNSITRRISDCDVAAPRQHTSCLPASEHQRGEIPARRCRNRESRFRARTARHPGGLALGSLLTVVRASLLPPRAAPLAPERLRGTNEETVPLTRRITMRTTGHGKLNIRSRMEEEGRRIGIYFP